MKVLILERNLLWTSRFTQTLRSLGHESDVLQSPPQDLNAYRVAIVHLADAALDVNEIVSELKSQGIVVIGHAGHKEVEALEAGRAAGCDRVATNGEITAKLPQIIEELGVAAR
ncbi:hypothetical protein FCG40_07025 [Fimbriimonadia bacterium ATM]|nr:MAG: hypothetical protein EDM73_03765 [Armatimonadota bacterium]MBC6968387.1 hypothetical protein [Armatimonadota bacterium]MCE7898775.1 hypothetical protein [Armatimonadetes bacterium ATM1]MDL1928728.1 hypothetical protein [Fimbriimonadia bacterium ATM]RIJ98493.1 MAG: hypothetical protein DCC45_01630 [Armatimonadota bacterium]